MYKLSIIYLMILLFSGTELFAQNQLNVVALVGDSEEDPSYQILNHMSARQGRIESLRKEVSFLEKNPYINLTEYYSLKEDSTVAKNILQADIIIYSATSVDFIRECCLKDSGNRFGSNSILILVDMKVDTAIKNPKEYLSNLHLQINKLFDRGLGCLYSCQDYRLNEVLKGFLNGSLIEQMIYASQVTTAITSGNSTLEITSLIHESLIPGKDTLVAYVCERKFIKSTNKVAVFNLLGNKITYPESCIARRRFNVGIEK